MNDYADASVLRTGSGTDLTVRQAGSGDPVLLLHGSGGPDTVSLLLTHFGADHRVLAPIHPGWAGTPLPGQPGGVAGLAATYLDLLESQGLTGVTVAGVSFGGWVAAEMAAADQSHRVGRLVLIDSLGPRIPGHHIATPATLPPASLTALQAYTGGVYDDPTLLDRLQPLTTPTLLVWGENDPAINVDFGRRYAAALPGARFEVIPGAGHVPMRDAPEATFAVLDGFLKG
ncbi:alpha/beta fold hydrolase [Actinoplanes sp. TBRC 11911]|uniref:alpha/beta fold hydrolase n=1 Tax=Actinoplanes sp. TBRC 11911 TaxID=2729386 RepID=UPI00145C70EB|nr:alpha/beta fold hydrolase [Actinoplanes sp. TBRC 11911]NMO49873.1 alpha/beta fold hydrolase [Actinoplanes sp. TBRC 11911]